jgi:ATP-dependent Clp protease ATP-binding subunit ClpA
MNEHPHIERFDERASTALREAEARLLQQEGIGTEHLLLGAVHVRALDSHQPLSADLEKNLGVVRDATERVIGRGGGTREGALGFTLEAQPAMAQARSVAQHSNRGYVGVKQLLFGLVSVPENHAQRILRSLGIDLDMLRWWIRPKPFPSTPDEVQSVGRLTEQAHRLMNLSQEEARRLQHHWVGTEHLLLGLLHQGEGKAFRVLTHAGVDPTLV